MRCLLYHLYANTSFQISGNVMPRFYENKQYYDKSQLTDTLSSDRAKNRLDICKIHVVCYYGNNIIQCLTIIISVILLKQLSKETYL